MILRCSLLCLHAWFKHSDSFRIFFLISHVQIFQQIVFSFQWGANTKNPTSLVLEKFYIQVQESFISIFLFKKLINFSPNANFTRNVYFYFTHSSLNLHTASMPGIISSKVAVKLLMSHCILLTCLHWFINIAYSWTNSPRQACAHYLPPILRAVQITDF